MTQQYFDLSYSFDNPAFRQYGSSTGWEKLSQDGDQVKTKTGTGTHAFNTKPLELNQFLFWAVELRIQHQTTHLPVWAPKYLLRIFSM